MSVSLGELSRILACELRGDPNTVVDRVANLGDADARAISFFTNPAHKNALASTSAAAVLIQAGHADLAPGSVLVCADPYLAYARAATLLHPEPDFTAGVDASAVIDPSATIDASAYVGPLCVIGKQARIGPGCYVGAGSIIGDNVELGAQCKLRARVCILHNCQLGQRVLIQPGAIIGGDGFGFANDEGRWVKIPQLGRVIIGDDVEVGANTTIDRGALQDTIIEQGVKLDNQIQVGHNVRIGAHTAVAGCVGIAGSTVIGRHCAIAGKVGISGHLTITDGVTITGGSIVLRSLPEPGIYSSGTPLQPEKQWKRNFLQFPRLDELVRRVRKLERTSK